MNDAGRFAKITVARRGLFLPETCKLAGQVAADFARFQTYELKRKSRSARRKRRAYTRSSFEDR